MTRRTPAGYVDLVVYVINLDNHRGAVTGRELQALHAYEVAEHGQPPAIIGLVECTGNRLPHLPDMAFDLGIDAGGPQESRGNVAAYVRTDLLASGGLKPRWTDYHRGWPRTKAAEEHPPRSGMRFRLGRVRVRVEHAPPLVAGARPAREEFVDTLSRGIAPWTRPGPDRLRQLQRRWQAKIPRLCLIDDNHLTTELIRRTGLMSVGTDVDRLYVGGDLEAEGYRYVDGWKTRDGRIVPFGGDHKRVLRVVVRVPARWLPAAGTADRTAEIPA